MTRYICRISVTQRDCILLYNVTQRNGTYDVTTQRNDLCNTTQLNISNRVTVHNISHDVTDLEDDGIIIIPMYLANLQKLFAIRIQITLSIVI